MSTQSNEKKIEQLEEIIHHMGGIIRELDEEDQYREQWLMRDTNDGEYYVPVLRTNNQLPVENNTASKRNSPQEVRVIVILNNGNVSKVHSTFDLKQVVVGIDQDSIDPIVIGNVCKPDSVEDKLSLTTLDIDLENVEDYQEHPWNGKSLPGGQTPPTKL